MGSVFVPQDTMVNEGQGPIQDRTKELLGSADMVRGVLVARQPDGFVHAHLALDGPDRVLRIEDVLSKADLYSTDENRHPFDYHRQSD